MTGLNILQPGLKTLMLKDMSAGPSGVGGGNNCTFYVSESSQSFSAEAGNTTVTVTTTEGFTVNDIQDWISLSEDWNNITITVTENTGSGSSNGTVTIYFENKKCRSLSKTWNKNIS